MKKLVLTFAIFGLLSVGLSSCNKTSSYTCDCSGTVVDYDDLNSDQAEAAKSACEGGNCTWAEK